MATRTSTIESVLGGVRVLPARRYRVPYAVLAPIYSGLIIGVPGCLAVALFALADGSVSRIACGLLAAPVYAIGYGLIAATIGRGYRASVVPGKFGRDLSSELYRARRLYGLCWTAIYYAKPIYHLFLSIPCLKRALFRLFGFTAALDFTIYPDTWIRDLPLLRIGRGAYVSNRATLGTNIVLSNGEILVDRITLGEGSLVGHLCMVGPGSSLGPKAEMGVGAAVGIRTRVGAGAKIGPQASLEHGVKVGANTVVGVRSFIGSGTRLGPDLVVPPASVIPPRMVILTQGDLEHILASKTRA